MELMELDVSLVEEARRMIKLRFKEDRHTVGAALRTKSGVVFSAVHLETHVGRMAVCAEAIALGMAAAQGDTAISVIVAVNHKGEVMAPCGMCREMISDYSPGALVILNIEDSLVKVPVLELLPHKYQRKI